MSSYFHRQDNMLSVYPWSTISFLKGRVALMGEKSELDQEGISFEPSLDLDETYK